MTYGTILKVTQALQDLRIPAHIKGYYYLRDAVVLVVESPEALPLITKELYPEVATRNKTTVIRVERAIRYAIEACWERSDEDILRAYFGGSGRKPTNKEAIYAISEKIRLRAA